VGYVEYLELAENVLRAFEMQCMKPGKNREPKPKNPVYKYFMNSL